MINFLPAMLLSAKLICPALTINNWTSEWTKQDTRNLKMAKTRCEKIYIDAPCLTVFSKVSPLTYRAICGKKIKEKLPNEVTNF